MGAASLSGFRLAPQQRYLCSQLESFADLFVQAVVDVGGELPPGRLEDALNAVATRHESLRTTFPRPPGVAVPVQSVADPPAAVTLTSHDLAGTQGRRRRKAVDAVRASERALLDPAAGPTFRAALVTLGRRRHLLVLTAHALVADRAALELVVGDLAEALDGGLADGDDVVQYADVAAWANDLLAGDDAAGGRAYWQARLDPDLVESASILERPGATAGALRSREVDLGIESSGLRALAERLGVPPAAVVQAAWSVVLWRRAGKRDLVLGSVLPGRGFEELAACVGTFERAAPLPFRLTNETAFADVVRTLSHANAEAREQLDYLDPGSQRGALRHLYEYVEQQPATRANGLVLRLADVTSHTSPFATKLVVAGGRAFSGTLHFVSGAVADDDAEELAAHLPVLLAAAAEDPSRPVGRLPLVGAEERTRLLGLPDATAAPYPEARLEHLVAEQARRTPEATAVAGREGRLTYAELDRRSDELAARLALRGAANGSLVAICMERSPDLLVALLATLKTGAAYVPIDPAYPADRIGLILDDAEPVAVLTQERLADTLPPGRGPVVYVDAVPGPETAGADGPVDAGVDDTAYVMYTSGSTGTPNGVVVTHRGLVNYLTWAAGAYRAEHGSVVHTSIAFDLTLTTLFAPLVAGGAVTLLPDEEGIAGLAAALRRGERFGIVKLTPTHLDLLTQLLEPEQADGAIETLVVGGEDLRAEAIAFFREHSPATRIVNEYGPTETVVGCTAYEVSAALPPTGRVPIGRPIANTRVFLLDEYLEPVPGGAAGELYVSSPGVAAGYLRRPQLTEQKFVHDPFAGRPDGRMYRTGDLARRTPEGELEFLGRVDDQLKIRGFRVEPGEIEAALAAHPAVATAAVVPWLDDDPGRSSPLRDPSPQLAGYVVPADAQAPPSAEELDDWCRSRLPEPMLPASYVVLPSIPTTPNGKVDRRALPNPRRRAGSDGTGFVAPRTATEEILAGAVSTVLGLARVGVDDDYFALGGDSIRSVMVVSRAQARGIEVTVADLHRHRTVRETAQAVDAKSPGATSFPETEPFSLVSEADRALVPADVEDAFPLNLLQEGMIFHRDFAAKSAVYHAIASVRLRAPFDLDVLRTVVRQLVERHPMLRVSFDQTTYSRPLQLVHRTFKDPLHFEDLRGLPEAEQEARVVGWVDREKQRGFELDEHPLIRFMAQRLGEETWQFTYGFHHEIVDGWSEALMITELFSHYFSIIFGEPVEIPPPSSTMRDAIALELRALEEQESYDFWSRYLADVTLMRLPRLLSGPKADKGEREIVRVAVPMTRELSDGAKQLALENAVPLKTVLLAAHLMVMGVFNGDTDTLTYTVTQGRPENADGSSAIGLFVNSLALRVNLAGGTWNDLISRTLETELASLPYRRLPMAELKRHQGSEPLAETLFFFTDYHVFQVLERWRPKGVEALDGILYGESTFPFCAIFRTNRDTGDLEVRIEYDSLQFPPELIASMSDCYVAVLSAMVADPPGRYETRSYLPADEERRVLVEWNDTSAGYPTERLIHELFEERARARPDAVALDSSEGSVSYGALDRAANALAFRLRRLGVAAETPVGILAERSPELIAAILGVLKAGGAYLPLDPALPADRIRALVEDARAPVVLAQDPGLTTLEGAPARVLRLADALRTAGMPARSPVAAARPESPAYVIYTSGSTGEPKGVVVSHRSLVSSTVARFRFYDRRPARFLLLSSFAFDSSVAGIFWTLCQGGTLLLPREGAQLEPGELTALLSARRATHLLAIPSLYGAVLEHAGPGDLDSLEVVIVAGEACPADLYDAHARGSRADFYNEYGPTEATVWSTVWRGDRPGFRTQVPIGRPIANTRVYVLSPHLQPVPVGVLGEASIGGAGVARGYLGKPAATAERFAPDPYSGVPGARLYRTGDLVRWNLEGELEFFDRSDNQVKIRGFRVELGEIESVLDAHPAVQRSVVVGQAAQGEKQLVAYVVPQPGEAPSADELRAYLRERLPKYMVPARWVVLDALPLTATGKVDRGALPAPAGDAAAAYVEPATDVERVLAGIWSQVLGVERVGVHDDFFDLGGESLSAMKATTKMNNVFRTKLSVRTMFEAPTIEGLARQVVPARARVEDEAPLETGVL